jgi:hypothetical protein
MVTITITHVPRRAVPRAAVAVCRAAMAVLCRQNPLSYRIAASIPREGSRTIGRVEKKQHRHPGSSAQDFR